MVFLGLLAGYGLFSLKTTSQPQEPIFAPASPVPEDSLEEGVLVPVYYPRKDLSGLEKREFRLSKGKESLAGWIRFLVKHLATPSSSELLAVFPEKTELLHVFANDQGGLFLDFSSSLTPREGVGVQLESLALKAFFRTLNVNVPGYQSVALLVEGRERETFWGHIYARKAFPLERF